MKAYITFMKKEVVEYYRTYKLLIMLLVFLVIGMTSPILAKVTPELLKSMLPEMTILPDSTAFDSWAQFFKNINQMGLIVLVILFSGLMSNEFSRGTLINILTKGLPRRTVILSKFTVASVIWTISYIVSCIMSYLYTLYFWNMDTIENLVFSLFCMWLFGILLLAVLMLGGIVNKNSYGCLLFEIIFIAILFLLNIIPKVQKYNPLSLANKNTQLLNSATVPNDLTASIIVTIVFILLSIALAIEIFNKKQI